jgi:hypothetical protein
MANGVWTDRIVDLMKKGLRLTFIFSFLSGGQAAGDRIVDLMKKGLRLRGRFQSFTFLE